MSADAENRSAPQSRVTVPAVYDLSVAATVAETEPGPPSTTMLFGLRRFSSVTIDGGMLPASTSRSGAPFPAATGAPILLVEAGSIPPSIVTELKRLKPKSIVVLGGPGSVSALVAAQLAAYVT